jgi:hypothetical protein
MGSNYLRLQAGSIFVQISNSRAVHQIGLRGVGALHL